jgi:hypothetical protein
MAKPMPHKGPFEGLLGASKPNLINVVHELPVVISQRDLERAQALATEQGMSLDDFVTFAANVELERRYLLAKKEGQLLQLPIRSKGHEA